MVPDVKRGGKLNRYKIFPLKTLLPTSLQYAERRRGGVKESKRWKRTRRQKEDQRSKMSRR